MAAKARQRSALFSWKRSAEIYLDEILRIVIALPVNGLQSGSPVSSHRERPNQPRGAKPYRDADRERQRPRPR
jgi:hypothetical protein